MKSLKIITILKKLNFAEEYYTFENSASALEKLESLSPEMVFLDLHMPEMDGLTAIQQIRLMPNGADLPIIALTALAMPNDRQRCIAAGATGYVAKPVKMRQLREMIHTMLFED